MSFLSFLFALCLVAGLSLAESLYSRQPSVIGRISVRPDRTVQNATRSGYNYARTWCTRRFGKGDHYGAH